MKKFTKELGPGWITLVENDDYALSRLIFGDGLEVDCDEEETPLLRKGFQQIQEYWTGHRVIFTLPLAPGGSDFEREVWETVIRIPYGEHFTTPTLLAALEYIAHIWGIALVGDEVWFSLGSGLSYTYAQRFGDDVYEIKSDGRSGTTYKNRIAVGSEPCGVRLVTNRDGKILRTVKIEEGV